MRSLTVIVSLLVAVVFLHQPSGAVAAGGPIKVFLMSGQSNMVGHGKVEMGRQPGTYVPGQSAVEIVGGLGSLRFMVNDDPGQFGHGGTHPLVNSAGDWIVRDDVKVYASVDNTIKKGNLTTGFGRSNSPWVGPEFGFGHTVGQAFDDDVLIVKIAWGGKTLAGDFRPPTAVAKRGGTVGAFWTQLINDVNTTLANLDTEFPEYTGRDVEIAGFGWHQGWNDGLNQTMVDEYEENMADFIRDIRDAFGDDLPFVIANSGFTGWSLSGRRLELLEAQLAMEDAAKYPEFVGNVSVVETRGFWQDAEFSPSNFVHHWNHNGITHYQIGAGMGDAMAALVPEPSSMMFVIVLAATVARTRRIG